MPLNETIAIIPARGGSKGIPQKNLQLIGEHSLVGHSILHAVMAGIPKNHIVVSSDCENILKNANDYGVTLIQRPSELATDTSSTEDAMLHACNELISRFKIKYVMLLQPTSPLRFMKTVRAFLDTFFRGLNSFVTYDSLISVTKFYNFFWRYVYDDQGEKAIPSYSVRPMRQAMDTHNMAFFENGNMYITTIDSLLTNKNRYGVRSNVFSISEIEGIQIDTLQDLEICRELYISGLYNRCFNIEYQPSLLK